jgi:transaldolase
MKATQKLQALGQSLWLDNITRGLLTSGTLGDYIAKFSVTGLTSNPSIFDQAIKNAGVYDDAIRKKALAGKSGEELFFELALEDLSQAADLLGIAIARRTYKAYRDLLASPRWQKPAASDARPQRLLWASTGTKDPAASDALYIEALAAPDSINTVSEKTLHAFAEHGEVKGAMPIDGGDAEEALNAFARAGIGDATLAAQLQREGTRSFDESWNDLRSCIALKSDVLKKVAQAGGK